MTKSIEQQLTELITHALEVDDLDDQQIAQRIMECFDVTHKGGVAQGKSNRTLIKECIEAGFSSKEAVEYVTSVRPQVSKGSVTSDYYLLRKHILGDKWVDGRKFNGRKNQEAK